VRLLGKCVSRKGNAPIFSALAPPASGWPWKCWKCICICIWIAGVHVYNVHTCIVDGLAHRWKYLIMRLPHDKSVGVDELPLQCKTSLAKCRPAKLNGEFPSSYGQRMRKRSDRKVSAQNWTRRTRVFIGKARRYPHVWRFQGRWSQLGNNGQTFIGNENKQISKQTKCQVVGIPDFDIVLPIALVF